MRGFEIRYVNPVNNNDRILFSDKVCVEICRRKNWIDTDELDL